MANSLNETNSAPVHAELERKKIWDVPTRLFHWLLAATVATGWWIGDERTFANINYHFYLGYTTGGLVFLRIVWGIIGPKPVRLSGLIPRPRALFAYLAKIGSRHPSGVAGHNPVGALSVAAMLGALAVQVLTGLCSEDDSLFASGPLAEYLSPGWVVTATAVHGFTSEVLFWLVVLHVSAVVFYLLWKRENLVAPMINGWKLVKAEKKDPDRNSTA